MSQSSDNALGVLEREYRALRARLTASGTSRPGADGDVGDEELVPRLRAEIPGLREQLLRYSRLECEILQTVVSADDQEPGRACGAEARCDVARQLLERLEALSNIGDEATFLAVFRFLTAHVLMHLDTTEEEVFPIAREHADVASLTRRMKDISDGPEPQG